MMAKTGPTAFFFLMIARPRTSTLFPYTTLFRSNGQGIIAGIVVAVEAQVFFFTFLRSGANAALRSKSEECGADHERSKEKLGYLELCDAFDHQILTKPRIRNAAAGLFHSKSALPQFVACQIAEAIVRGILISFAECRIIENLFDEFIDGEALVQNGQADVDEFGRV